MAPTPTTPGELVHAADYACAWRVMEPAPASPRALLVLLHGVDGDEMQLAGIAARMPADVLVALPRGHRSISGGRIGWYRVGMSEDGLQVVEDEAQEARTRLGDFIAQLQRHYDVPASRTLLAGFSQGGILAATLALTTPGNVAGFAMLAGQLLPEDAERYAPRDRLSHLDVLLVHGRDDETLAVDEATSADATLRAMGLAPVLHLHDGGHVLSQAMEDDVAAWLQQRVARMRD